MSITVRSTFPDGTGSVMLGQLGQVSGWKHTLTFPGGPTAASFTFAADPQLNHPAIQMGRLVYAYAGTALVWAGRLLAPQKGTPWQCQAVGLAAMAKDHISGTGLTLNAAVDAAIGNRLPWKRTASLNSPSTPTDGTALTDTSTLDDLLGLVVAQGGYWNLTPAGVVSTPAGPDTAPSYLLACLNWPGQTQQNFATAITGTYSAGTVQVSAAAAVLNQYGWIETAFDTAAAGSTAATTAANAQLAVLDTPNWAGAFSAPHGTLISTGGVVVNGATVRPGCVVRVTALQTGDSYGVVNVDIPIGQVDYDDDTDVAALLPLGAYPHGFASLFERLFTG